jgi:phage shock protein PspC (stress-responsive transcriptional regulator)
MKQKRELRRSMSKGQIGGVCAGIADYTDTDVTIWRLLFVIGTLFTVLPFILIYLIMWIVIPEE